MAATVSVGLLDTSIFIASETGRPLAAHDLPDEAAVSIITVAELRWGVLNASDDETRSRRLDTLHDALALEPIPIDDRVAAAWALLRQQLGVAGKRMGANDAWIAATALAHHYPVVTQDGGFPDGIPGLTVIRA
jgi:predicted nucleic acid-binding protein